jgi:hypothetical protein
MNRLIGIAILAMLTGACSAQDHGTKRTLTERQRDSVLSRSELPGAGVVGRAMKESDAAAQRSQDVNAAVDSLPH